jgi:hypothetical protein
VIPPIREMLPGLLIVLATFALALAFNRGG